MSASILPAWATMIGPYLLVFFMMIFASICIFIIIKKKKKGIKLTKQEIVLPVMAILFAILILVMKFTGNL